jgi:protein TonB
MEIKKTRKAELEGSKTSSFLMGIVLGLAVLFVGFEWSAFNREIVLKQGGTDLWPEEVLITLQEETPPPLPPPPAVIETLKVVGDDENPGDTPPAGTEDTPTTAQPNYGPPPLPPKDEDEEADGTIFLPFAVDAMPQFPGGEAELMQFLAGMVKYPAPAIEQGIQGRVICSFTVNRDGSVVDAKVVRGIDPSLDKEALRVIGLMPKWKPGLQSGKPVRVSFTVPILFRLKM